MATAMTGNTGWAQQDEIQAAYQRGREDAVKEILCALVAEKCLCQKLEHDEANPDAADDYFYRAEQTQTIMNLVRCKIPL